MKYKVEQVAADKYAVMKEESWLFFFKRWSYVKHDNSTEIRYFSTRRAAQAYINYQTNPNMKWK